MTTAPDPVGRSTDAGELSHVRADGTAKPGYDALGLSRCANGVCVVEVRRDL